MYFYDAGTGKVIECNENEFMVLKNLVESDNSEICEIEKLEDLEEAVENICKMLSYNFVEDWSLYLGTVEGSADFKLGSEGALEDETVNFQMALEAGTYRQQEKEASEYSAKVLEVTGVPTIYLNGKKIAVEHYTKEEMVQILQEGQEDSVTGMCCGIDGCN